MITVRFTGLDALRENLVNAPDTVEKHVSKALGLSLSAVEMEAKKRTPVDTGLLQGSIGGEGGYSYVRGLTAGVGTNVRYAVYVETNERARHKTGQAHYMEEGVGAASDFIQDKFEEAMENIANDLADTK